ELSASRRAFGNAEYDRLRDEGPDLRITKRAEEYLTQPRVQAMWDEANQTGLIGMRPDLADLSMSKALDIRDQLTGAIGRAQRAGNNQLRENLQEVRRGFNRILANQS